MYLRFATALRPMRVLPTTARRTFVMSARMSLKEDANRTPEQIEKKKQEQLRKQEKGEGHWYEELASSSESDIAADKEQVKDHDSHIKKLQEETKKKGEKGELEVCGLRPAYLRSPADACSNYSPRIDVVRIFRSAMDDKPQFEQLF